MTTLAPRAARSKAIEEPIPREAPVTMALGLISCVKEGAIGGCVHTLCPRECVVELEPLLLIACCDSSWRLFSRCSSCLETPLTQLHTC